MFSFFILFCSLPNVRGKQWVARDFSLIKTWKRNAGDWERKWVPQILCAPPPHCGSENKQGQGSGGRCLCLCICCIWKHKCLKMMNPSTNVCFSCSAYTGSTEISYGTNKQWEIWLRRWEAKFIAFPNPEVRLDKTRETMIVGESVLPPPLFTVTAGRNVVLVVLIFDISSHFHRICCGKAVMHMYAHVCTHRKDRTTCTFLLQKHTDNLYLCVHSVGFPPINILIPCQLTPGATCVWAHVLVRVLISRTVLTHHHRIIHTRLHTSTTIINRIFKFIHHTCAVTKW